MYGSVGCSQLPYLDTYPRINTTYYVVCMHYYYYYVHSILVDQPLLFDPVSLSRLYNTYLQILDVYSIAWSASSTYIHIAYSPSLKQAFLRPSANLCPCLIPLGYLRPIQVVIVPGWLVRPTTYLYIPTWY